MKKMNEFFEKLDIKMAVKITITALLSWFICLQLDVYLKHPEDLIAGLWCVIASIIVLQTHIGGTYRAIANRFLGVLIGSAFGAFFALTLGAEIPSLGLAIFLTLMICSILGIPESYRMAALSVVIIMIPWKVHPTSDPRLYAFFRFFDTCLGFAVAILVSHLLWPTQALTKMRMNMAETFSLFRQYFEHLLIPDEIVSKSQKISDSLVSEIEQNFVKSREVLEESKVELLVRFAPVGVWVDLLNSQTHLWESLRSLKNVFSLKVKEVFDEDLNGTVQRILEGVDLALKELSTKLKTGESGFNFTLLKQLNDGLNQELVRFRSTHTTKKYNLEVVEDYFVFFYQLKQTMSNLFQFNEYLNQLKLGNGSAEIED